METVTSKKEQLSELKGLLQKLKVKGVFQNNMIIATKKGSDKFHFLQDDLFSINQIAYGTYSEIKEYFEKRLGITATAMRSCGKLTRNLN